MQTPYLQREEIEQLLRSIPHTRDRLLARFLYESGCGVSDLTELKTSAVHSDGTITFADRVAQISQELAQELLGQAHSYVFGTRQAQTITAKRVQQILKPYLSAFRKHKPTPHLLRYSHVVHAYTQGVSLLSISKQTGLGTQRLAQIVANVSAGRQYGAFFSGKGGKQ